MDKISFTTDHNIAVSTPLFRPDPNFELKLNEGTGTYVKKSPTSGLFNTTPKGFLESTLTDEDINDERLLALGKEEDITKRVNSAVPVFTTPIGIRYKDGSMGVALCFRDGIVEYRSNLGLKSATPSKVPGKETIYGVTYISVGIPEARYNWIVKQLAEVFELRVTSKDNVAPKIHNGYAWFVANISNDAKPQAHMIRGAHRESATLRSMLGVFEKSLIGVVTVTMSLKRVLEDGELTYGFSMSLKAMQVSDITVKGSPKLANAIEFIEDKDVQTSDTIWSQLQRAKPPPAARKPIVASGTVVTPSVSTT
jgi:hypothetical protein